MFRKLAAVLAVLAVVLLGPVPAASAVQAVGPVVSAEIPDFTPSGNKFREFMLNITSKVLGSSMPDKWRAEQIANQHRYAPSADQLNRMYGYSNFNPNYATAPDSFEDFVLREKTKVTKDGGRVLIAPATKGKAFLKGALGAGSFLSGVGFVAGLGSAGIDFASGWFGIDTQGRVCSWSQGAGLVGTAVEVLTWRDCSMFGLSEDYRIDPDQPVQYCGKGGNPVFSGCVILRGVVVKEETSQHVVNWRIAVSESASPPIG